MTGPLTPEVREILAEAKRRAILRMHEESIRRIIQAFAVAKRQDRLMDRDDVLNVMRGAAKRILTTEEDE